MASWLTRAAELGHPQGMMELSKAYWKGTGVKPDIVSAYMWARLSTDLNLSEAALQLALIRKELDPKQYKKAERKAADWKKQHRFLTYRSSIIAP
jgi:TPR repeat protein